MNKKRLNIGIDIHGCIDLYIPLFKELSIKWAYQGHIVHIITGEPKRSAEQTVIDAGVHYDHFFSIVDYHVENNTPSLRQDEKGHYWVDRNVWLATKGDYGRRVGLDIHFDNQIEYFGSFPKTCSLIYVPPTNFEKVLDSLSI